MHSSSSEEFERNDIQALLEDSSTSASSSANEAKNNLEKQSSPTTEHLLNGDNEEERVKSQDHVKLDVEKTEYWNNLYDTEKSLQQSNEQIRDQKALTSKESDKFNKKEQLANTKQEAFTGSLKKVSSDTEGNDSMNDHAESILLRETSKLQATYGDCDKSLELLASLSQPLQSAWCQLAGVNPQLAKFGNYRLEELRELEEELNAIKQ
eukprot:jgi/Galph1/2196/GphlegSOOS_G914.1